MSETELQMRLRRMKETLAYLREREDVARREHFEASEATRAAKLKYEELFLAEEKAESARRKASYCHATK